MANRPVYVPMNQAPYYKAIDIEFVYNRGLNIKQKQKNILAIHEIFMQRYPENLFWKFHQNHCSHWVFYSAHST